MAIVEKEVTCDVLCSKEYGLVLWSNFSTQKRNVSTIGSIECIDTRIKLVPSCFEIAIIRVRVNETTTWRRVFTPNVQNLPHRVRSSMRVGRYKRVSNLFIKFTVNSATCLWSLLQTHETRPYFNCLSPNYFQLLFFLLDKLFVNGVVKVRRYLPSYLNCTYLNGTERAWLTKRWSLWNTRSSQIC